MNANGRDDEVHIASFVGQHVRVNISGTTQTSAGRLVFGDIAN